MLPKRLISTLFLISFILTSTAGCDTVIKMSAREGAGNPSLTPFLPKATFTVTAAAPGQSDAEEKDQSSLTATDDAEATSESGLEMPTPSSTPTVELYTSTVTPTLTPSATLNPGAPTYTISPPTATTAPTYTFEPADTSVPGYTPVSTNTSIPTITIVPTSTLLPSNTPVPSNTPEPTNTSVPAGCSPSGNSNYESQVINLINQERTSRGLSELSNNSSLVQAARRHSEDMACNDFFSHTGSDGSTLSSRVLAAGYSYSWVAENIAASSSCSFSAQSVVNMWMNSTGHRNNILNANAVHIGVGFRCVSDSISGDLDGYYTADFGKP